ncbi:hypothetical protein IFR05_005481, partial [Cadophora sp. M221]
MSSLDNLTASGPSDTKINPNDAPGRNLLKNVNSFLPGPLTTFTLFPKLPMELRIEIYKINMRRGRLIEI